MDNFPVYFFFFRPYDFYRLLEASVCREFFTFPLLFTLLFEEMGFIDLLETVERVRFFKVVFIFNIKLLIIKVDNLNLGDQISIYISLFSTS